VATIVLVVADTTSLGSGDTILQNRLTSNHGHTVVLRNDEDAEYGSAYDGVMVSDSCVAATFGSKYDTVAKPGICLEGLASGWRLGTSSSAGSGVTQWDVQSVPAANAGLTGAQTIYSAGAAQQGLTTSSVPAGGQIVAYESGATTKAVYVIYESGGTLTSGTAPARRVFFRAGNADVANLTSTGLSLLDAAITWAYGGTNIARRTGGFLQLL
jgi:hypothetical protein